ncbi:MAG: LLM class flavin-dependent oxidoreductase, partial [Actinobacteria bacterium]|nr:LLM class flavin-dependent oxidoreductase [Actinomycetota bacterium]
MKIGLFGGAAQSGTVDQVVAEAKLAERDGFSSYWMPQIFAHDALTLLALIGREV